MEKYAKVRLGVALRSALFEEVGKDFKNLIKQISEVISQFYSIVNPIYYWTRHGRYSLLTAHIFL